MITFGELFAGIGGFSLGFERAGLVKRWSVEIDPYCQKVLRKHWPNCGEWDDVRTFPPNPAEDWEVDVICGGFPCQDISSANYRAEGLSGKRSGLWTEYIRIIREIQPQIVCVENVSAITFRGLDRVLWDLARGGFNAEWQTLPAQAFGAPHGRDRVFIVAYRSSIRPNSDEFFSRSAFETAGEKQASRVRRWPGERKPSVVDANRFRWCPNSELCRVADGVPDELDRYRALGNAVVPAVAEWIGARIAAHLGRLREEG